MGVAIIRDVLHHGIALFSNTPQIIDGCVFVCFVLFYSNRRFGIGSFALFVFLNVLCGRLRLCTLNICFVCRFFIIVLYTKPVVL